MIRRIVILEQMDDFINQWDNRTNSNTRANVPPGPARIVILVLQIVIIEQIILARNIESFKVGGRW